MKKKLLDLSGKIEPLFIEILRLISQKADELAIPFFVVGATARDIILKQGYDISTIRATRDIDIGAQVSGWDSYDKLKTALLSTDAFTPAREPHRLLFKSVTRVDIVPFGAIAKPDQSISWPPDNETAMSTLGFDEAYSYSQTVRLCGEPVLDVQFATPYGLALMKLISWDDSYPSRSRDAQDLALLLTTYTEAGNADRIFDEASGLLEQEDFDYVRVGARLLGRDMAAMMSPKTMQMVTEIMNRETGNQKRYRLVEDMIKGGPSSKDVFEDYLRLLEEMKLGISE